MRKKLHEDVNHLNNIIALCRDCHKEFDNPRTVEEYRELFSIKKNILSKNETRTKYHDHHIENEIKEVITTLVEGFGEGYSQQLEMNALRLDEKADKSLTPITKRRIRNEIRDYYLYIQEQFRQLDSNYPQSFHRIALQVSLFL